MFSGIAHVLIGSKFNKLFYLCFRYLRVLLETIRRYFINISIISPFMYIRKVMCKFCKLCIAGVFV
jgi:hypothetical protein